MLCLQSNVLISNWLEERELRRTQLKQLLSNKTGGTLKLDAFNRKMATALQEVELTKITEDDGFSHFGDVSGKTCVRARICMGFQTGIHARHMLFAHDCR